MLHLRAKRRRPNGKFQEAASASFKAKVALQPLNEIKTSTELVSEFQVHPAQICNWKTTAKKKLADVFADRRKKKEPIAY